MTQIFHLLSFFVEETGNNESVDSLDESESDSLILSFEAQHIYAQRKPLSLPNVSSSNLTNILDSERDLEDEGRNNVRGLPSEPMTCVNRLNETEENGSLASSEPLPTQELLPKAKRPRAQERTPTRIQPSRSVRKRRKQ